MMTNLLKDMLPDAPREANVLITAAGAGVPTALRGYLEQGMEAGTATLLAAGTLAERTALTADACTWATSSLPTALLPQVRPLAPGPGGPSPLPGSDHPTMAPQGTEPAVTLVARPARGRPAGVSLLGAAFAGAGALATVLACAFSI